VASLPAQYYQALHAGETYTVLYPGGEVQMWDWGTIEEHRGKEMKARHLMSPSEGDANLPRLMIPGGARVSFTVRAEEASWPGRLEYEARHGFEATNLAEQQWRQEEAQKSMRIIEGWPAPFGPEDLVYVHLIHPFSFWKACRTDTSKQPGSAHSCRSAGVCANHNSQGRSYGQTKGHLHRPSLRPRRSGKPHNDDTAHHIPLLVRHSRPRRGRSRRLQLLSPARWQRAALGTV
jgi:hypothetical protein